MSQTAQLSKPASVASWIFQITAAVIMLQTLYFKLTGAPETIYIFKQIGLGDAGRYGTAFAELIAGILLLWPRFAWAGAVLGIGIMIGAIGAQLGPIGIEIVIDGKSDGGSLFALAVVTFVSCIIVLILRFKQIPFFAKK